jgi:hypothetical protein
MRNLRLVAGLFVLIAAGLMLATGPLANAQEGITKVAAVTFGAPPNHDLPGDDAAQYVSHNLCGVDLGGYCPRGYRGCIRAGRPRAECEARLAHCESCNQAMVRCRNKVGHQPGLTCAKCRKALDHCRAGPIATGK